MKFFDKVFKHIAVCGFTLFIVVFAGLFFLNCQKIPASAHLKHEVSMIPDGWYYLDENGNKISVTLPADISYNGSVLTLENDSLTEEQSDLCILSKGLDRYMPTIYCGENQVYQYTEIYFTRSKHNRSSSFTTCPLKHTDTPVLSIRLANMDEAFHIEPFYIGATVAVDMFMIRDSSITIFFCILLTGLGFVAILAYFAILFLKYREDRLLHLGVLVLVYCIWHVFTCSYAYTLQKDLPIISLLNHTALGLIPIPLLLFSKESRHQKKSMPISLCLFYSIATVIMQALLQYEGKADISNTLILSHISLFLALLVSTWEVIRDYIRYRQRDTLFYIIGLSLLYFGTILSVVSYWLIPKIPFGYIIDVCFLVLYLLQLQAVASNISFSMQATTELNIFRSLASEDILTGLKNRRGFEQDLEDMMKKLTPNDDIALIYMDVNFLKETNDTLGHDIGDQLLVAISNSIRNTFGRNCYRIGGDEFCALVLNPEDLQGTWLASLDDSIQKGQGRYSFSIAKGFSMLRDHNGNLKSTNVWEREAERMMYENKRAAKPLA